MAEGSNRSGHGGGLPRFPLTSVCSSQSRRTLAASDRPEHFEQIPEPPQVSHGDGSRAPYEDPPTRMILLCL